MTGKELRKWRELHLHSQQSLADALGVSWRTILRWEQNDTSIPKAVEMALRNELVQSREAYGRWPDKK